MPPRQFRRHGSQVPVQIAKPRRLYDTNELTKADAAVGSSNANNDRMTCSLRRRRNTRFLPQNDAPAPSFTRLLSVTLPDRGFQADCLAVDPSRTAEIGLEEIRVAKSCAGEIRTAQIGAEKARAAQIGALERGICKF